MNIISNVFKDDKMTKNVEDNFGVDKHGKLLFYQAMNILCLT